MPYAPKRPCRHPGCREFCDSGNVYCKVHNKEMSHDAYRGTSSSRGYGWEWQIARKAWLRQHPLCVMCKAEGRIVAASVVDHIVPHRGDKELFWDKSNWQSLCAMHHNDKTGHEM